MKISKSELLSSVKDKCKDCCCGELKEVKLCEIKDCPLYPIKSLFYNDIKIEIEPKRRKSRGPMSEDHKAALKAGREAAKARKGE